eukprot:349821_1
MLTKYTNPAQTIVDLESTIKCLRRDKKVLQHKIKKLESTSGKKQKQMDNEREMRLTANKEKYALKQKLDKLQKAIAARLKRLGVDFSKISDVSTALDTSFNVIKKLAKELQQKEEQLKAVNDHNNLLIDGELVSKNQKQIFDNKIETLNQTIKTFENEQYENLSQIEKLNKTIKQLKGILNKKIEKLNKTIKIFENEKYENLSKIKELNRKNDLLCEKNIELFNEKTQIEIKLDTITETLSNIQSENEIQYETKCNEYENNYNELYEKYKKLINEFENNNENMKLRETEYKMSMEILEDKMKNMNTINEKDKEIEGNYKNQITILHDEIMEKDKIISIKNKKILKLQDKKTFGTNKKFSQMSLLKQNVKNMNRIIKDRDNQIKTLNNKLKSAQREK